jgi:GrpB-like predicted nucleotidyltransferase (UPF0157 family)
MSQTLPDAPVDLVPYDAAWPSRFEKERMAISDVLRDLIVGSIEHVGSTAIPGIEAKPILDIMVGIRDLSAPEALVQMLGRIGYLYYPYRLDVMHWFCKPSPSFAGWSQAGPARFAIASKLLAGESLMISSGYLPALFRDR